MAPKKPIELPVRPTTRELKNDVLTKDAYYTRLRDTVGKILKRQSMDPLTTKSHVKQPENMEPGFTYSVRPLTKAGAKELHTQHQPTAKSSLEFNLNYAYNCMVHKLEIPEKVLDIIAKSYQERTTHHDAKKRGIAVYHQREKVQSLGLISKAGKPFSIEGMRKVISSYSLEKVIVDAEHIQKNAVIIHKFWKILSANQRKNPYERKRYICAKEWMGKMANGKQPYSNVVAMPTAAELAAAVPPTDWEGSEDDASDDGSVSQGSQGNDGNGSGDDTSDGESVSQGSPGGGGDGPGSGGSATTTKSPRPMAKTVRTARIVDTIAQPTERPVVRTVETGTPPTGPAILGPAAKGEANPTRVTPILAAAAAEQRLKRQMEGGEENTPAKKAIRFEDDEKACAPRRGHFCGYKTCDLCYGDPHFEKGVVCSVHSKCGYSTCVHCNQEKQDEQKLKEFERNEIPFCAPVMGTKRCGYRTCRMCHGSPEYENSQLVCCVYSRCGMATCGFCRHVKGKTTEVIDLDDDSQV